MTSYLLYVSRERPRIRSNLLLLKVFVVLLLTQAGTPRADEKILHEFPVLQYSEFSTQGTSVGIRSHASRTKQAFVYNYELDKLLHFESGDWVFPPIFFNSGRNFITQKPVGHEGPLLTSVYGLDGEKIRDTVIDHLVLPSPSGTYYFSIPMRVIFPARPVLYDSLFQKVPEFPQDITFGDWHAAIFGDSTYLLHKDESISKFRLPSCELQAKYSVNLQGGGWPRHFFYNSSGSVCAISNRQDIGLINTESGYTQVLSGVLADTAYISTNGDTCAFVNCRRTSFETRVYTWADTRYNEVSVIKLDLNDYFPEAVYATVSGVYSVDQGLLVNLRVVRALETPDWSRAFTLLLTYGSDKSRNGQAQLLDGPSWSAKVKGVEKVLLLDSDDAGKAFLKVDAVRELREQMQND